MAWVVVMRSMVAAWRPGRKDNFDKIIAKTFDVTIRLCYTSNTFDENLHEHISHELAGHVGRESDTS